mmetsp:Transcript_12939/g.25693  ORF Transcript_12939/g.25693 Transcript_12939/m.25693 type:complete len:335 (-) Transcript_12939:17-1021(-)
MFARTASVTAAVSRAFSSTAASQHKVAVLGAGGGIGQPMSLLLQLAGEVSELALYDVAPTAGIAADIGHCDSRAKCTGYTGEDLSKALDGADVVVIPAGVPRKPGMTRDDLFNTNASIVATLANACAQHAPNACLGIISNPVNSTVPICREVLRSAGVYNPQKLFGITTLDVVRSNKFVGDAMGWDPANVNVTVIGGHAGTTILPLLSQVQGLNLDDETLAALSHRIQFGGDEVVQAKDGAGSATLSMAHAGAKFTVSLLRALNGEANVTECTFVENDLTDAPFFATPVTLGRDGVDTVHPFGELSAFEQQNFEAMLPDLQAQAEKGIKFAQSL